MRCGLNVSNYIFLMFLCIARLLILGFVFLEIICENVLLVIQINQNFISIGSKLKLGIINQQFLDFIYLIFSEYSSDEALVSFVLLAYQCDDFMKINGSSGIFSKIVLKQHEHLLFKIKIDLLKAVINFHIAVE